MKGFIKTVFFCTISCYSFAQDSLHVEQKNNENSLLLNLSTPKKYKYTTSLDRLAFKADAPKNTMMKQPSVFDAKKLPIFCKIEHKLAKSSNVNVMMRLGSLEYVDKLEGKTP